MRKPLREIEVVFVFLTKTTGFPVWYDSKRGFIFTALVIGIQEPLTIAIVPLQVIEAVFYEKLLAFFKQSKELCRIY